MFAKLHLPALSGLALVSAQAVIILTSTQSGVDPIVPTPFPGVPTIEGAITYDGPPVPGFTGRFALSLYLSLSAD